MDDAVVVVGGSGHSKVVVDNLRSCGQSILGILDDDLDLLGKNVNGISVLGASDRVDDFIRHPFIIAIGQNSVRERLYLRTKDRGGRFIAAVHRSAVISESALIGHGCALMANVVINASSVIGDNCIINTSASVDHDCVIGDHSHIGPGVHLCGGVRVGEGTLIGVGVSVIPNISIGKNVVIGAGAVVVCDVPDNSKIKGVPAR